MSTTSEKKVLIADDEMSVRSLLKKTLNKSYTVFEAEDGEKAVDMARQEKPDIVLMDVMMPRLDGIGACKVIKSDPETNKAMVIMVTARYQDLDQEYARDMGADGYIVKPFRPRELLKTIDGFLA